jgi:hypothetical protein
MTLNGNSDREAGRDMPGSNSGPNDRRSGADRRDGDRRVQPVALPVGQRSGRDRRKGDRRREL